MDLNIKYPRLFQFFVGYFSDSDFEELTDKEIILKYIDDCNKSNYSKKELKEVEKDILDLSLEIDNFWESLSAESNIYFENSNDALIWLDKISTILKDNLPDSTKHKIRLLDILEVDEAMLRKRDSDMAFYTGILESNIPVGTSFQYLYGTKEDSVVLKGSFTIQYVEILSKPSEELVKGYNATIFIKSSITSNEMKSLFGLSEKENIKNVFELTNVIP